ncbi:peptidase S8/S53 domain-containing protein [Blastocladiella britannica]|nr:peptidase S8/S53 domain-containing protein [Blastocladiella britannica]
MTNVAQIKSQFPSLRGEGVKVGIIDTGIDWQHPAFAIPGQTCTEFKGPGCRVQYGLDLVGDNYDSNTPGKDVPVPDADPMDCNGHGTHCAGITGGYDNVFEGVAPGIVLASYRVFGCTGSTSTDTIVAALESAYEDAMDVVSMSIGGGHVGADFAEGLAVDALSAGGTYVVSAASNSGTSGYSYVTSPSTSSLGLSVASYDNTFVGMGSSIISGAPGLNQVPTAYSDVAFEVNKAFPVIRSQFPNDSLIDGCNVAGVSPFKADQFKGGVALIRRGTCTFVEKATNAQAAGASGVIIYNRLPEVLAAGSLGPTITIPVAFFPGTEGQKLWTAAAAPGVTFKATADLAYVPNANAGLPSDFSSWGLDVNLRIKPEIAAPGGAIFSSYPRASGSYSVLSGTSMATPYIAGVTALYVQVNGPSQGTDSYLEYQRRLMGTARPSAVPGNVAGSVESVAKVGAGLVDAYQLLFGTTVVSPAKLELGDSPNWPKADKKTAVITVTNSGKLTQTYTLAHTPSRSFLGENGVATANFLFSDNHARVTFDKTQVTLQAGQSTQVKVTVDPNTPLITKLPADGHWVYSGYVTFQTKDRKNLNVPYAVILGDYKTFPVLATGANAPVLSNANLGVTPGAPTFDGSSVPTFDLSSAAQTPGVLLSTTFPVRKFTTTVFKASDKSVVGYITVDEFVEKIPNVVVPFTGSVLASADPKAASIVVPDGDYFIGFQYVQPTTFKNPDNLDAALFTAWASPKFTVKRPVVASSSSAAAPKPTTPSIPPAKIPTGAGVGHSLPTVTNSSA